MNIITDAAETIEVPIYEYDEPLSLDLNQIFGAIGLRYTVAVESYGMVHADKILNQPYVYLSVGESAEVGSQTRLVVRADDGTGCDVTVTFKIVIVPAQADLIIEEPFKGSIGTRVFCTCHWMRGNISTSLRMIFHSLQDECLGGAHICDNSISGVVKNIKQFIQKGINRKFFRTKAVQSKLIFAKIPRHYPTIYIIHQPSIEGVKYKWENENKECCYQCTGRVPFSKPVPIEQSEYPSQHCENCESKQH